MTNWLKSSLSTHNGNCVEVARGTRDDVLMRNSRAPLEKYLSFTANEWVAFIAGVKAGEFDDLVE